MHSARDTLLSTRLLDAEGVMLNVVMTFSARLAKEICPLQASLPTFVGQQMLDVSDEASDVSAEVALARATAARLVRVCNYFQCTATDFEYTNKG